MNKSEKLLAARKKLKEFQLGKRGNATIDDAKKNVKPYAEDIVAPRIVGDVSDVDDDVRTRTESTEREVCENRIPEVILPPSESRDTLESNADRENGSKETKVSDSSNASRFFRDAVDFGSGNSAIGEFNNVSDYSKERNDYLSGENRTSVDVRGYFFDSNESNRDKAEPDISNVNEIEKEDSQTEIRSSNDYGSLVGSQTLQKEYLLQMTSAVANVLTDDSTDDGGTTRELNSDLEERNQFLASRLQEQKNIIDRLHLEVNQYKSRVAELEAAAATKDAEFEAKLYRELNPLKEQLQLHAQTTGILVGEKAELTAALVQSQTTAKQKVAEVEELNGKLKSVHIQLSDLERELNSLKNSSDDVGKVNHRLQASYDTLENKYSQIKQERDDLELETAELRQKLNVKNTELTNIEQELKEKSALLSLNELRMQQMTSSPQGDQGIGEQRHVVAALEQQLSQLMETLKAVSSERDEASSHYQNYVQQLNAQVTGLALKLEETTKENAELSSRESSLIQRLSELERQIQSQKETTEPSPPVFNDDKERIDRLEKSLDQLTIERDSLRASLNEKDLNIDALKRETEELQEMRSSNAEASRLASALEGERLAAARAVSQNQQLKQQLSEMQDAFVQLSNAKLDLTEQLQGERAIGRKLNARLNDTENDVDKLKEEIQRKDSLLVQFEKEKLQTAQIADQMQHYQAKSHYAGTLQQELHNAQEKIMTLTKENQRLIGELNAAKTADQPHNGRESLNERSDEKESGTGNDIEENEIQLSSVVTQTDFHGDDGDTATVTAGQDTETITPEAVHKLQERFKNTMERLAELSDEKQRLEHLVLQLQSETETIGEYVALYQKQRGVLQERAKEKEEAFRRLTEQRNQQQEQLHKLKMLVADLIKEKTASAVPPIESNESRREESNHLGQEIPDRAESVVVKDETTSQILDLLTEIKECKNTCASEPNFHPCPWCSGKLITV